MSKTTRLAPATRWQTGSGRARRSWPRETTTDLSGEGLAVLLGRYGYEATHQTWSHTSLTTTQAGCTFLALDGHAFLYAQPDTSTPTLTAAPESTQTHSPTFCSTPASTLSPTSVPVQLELVALSIVSSLDPTQDRSVLKVIHSSSEFVDQRLRPWQPVDQEVHLGHIAEDHRPRPFASNRTQQREGLYTILSILVTVLMPPTQPAAL